MKVNLQIIKNNTMKKLLLLLLIAPIWGDFGMTINAPEGFVKCY